MMMLVYLFSAAAFALLLQATDCHLQTQHSNFQDGRHYSTYDDEFRGIESTRLKRETNNTGIDQDGLLIRTRGSCKDAAANILVRMNPDTHPCDDFYNFACGGQYIDNKENIALQNLQNALSYLKENKNKNDNYLKVYSMFYKTCVEYRYNFANTIEQSKAFIPTQIPTNLTELFIDLTLSQSMPFFDVGLDIDEDQNYVLQLTLPGSSSLKTGLKLWTVVEQLNEKCSKIIWKNVTTESRINEINSSIKSCSAAEVKKYIHAYKEYLEFINGGDPLAFNFEELEAFLVKIQENLPALKDIKIQALTRKHETFNIKELQEQFDIIDWQDFLQAITANNASLNEDNKVHVYFANYLQKIFKILKSYDTIQLSRILKDYYNFPLFIKTILSRNKGNDEQYCFNLANELMPDIATIIAYESTYSKMDFHVSNVRMQSFFKDFKQILQESIEKSGLETSSKTGFNNTLKNVTLGLIKAGDSHKSNVIYANVIMLDDHQKNLMILMSHMRKTLFSYAGTKATPTSLLNHFLDPYSNRPKSFYGISTVVYHPAIFLDTIMDPEYIGLSKNGMEIARELIRNFDLINAHRFGNATKAYKKLETQASILFEELMKDNLMNSEQLNSTLASNEILIDNAAFAMVFDKFMSLKNLKTLPWISPQYSNTQVFFLSFAQEYCQHSSEADNMRNLSEQGKLPIAMKIRNILGNIEQFMEAFECPDGSAMLIDSSLRSQFPNIQYDDDYEYAYP